MTNLVARDWHTDTIYEDRGCWASPACLECPLPQCVEELSASEILSLKARRRREEIGEWWRERPELRAVEVAEAWGVTERTAHRISAEMRE